MKLACCDRSTDGLGHKRSGELAVATHRGAAEGPIRAHRLEGRCRSRGQRRLLVEKKIDK